MPASGDEISFALRPSFERIRGQHWLIVRLAVGKDIVWDMIPNPTRPHSCISPRALDDLRRRMGPPRSQDAGFLIQDLRIAEQPIPDIPVQVDANVARLRVDGMLGLDFFELFEEVRWSPRTRRVTLVIL